MVKKLTFLTVSFFFMIAATMRAQVTTAGISGKVTDKEGAVIGATVVATHEPSGTTYGTVTNVDGRYTLTGMRVGGPYKVEVSYIGYGKSITSGITLQLGEVYSFDVELKEESVSLGEIVVTGDRTAVFNSQKTGAASNFGRTKIEQTPTISRSLFDVTRLTPQAISAGSGMSFAGSNNKYNSFQIDGTVNNDVFGLSSSGTNGGQSGANPISLDAIEEVQVVIAPFDVRQSGFTGGGVNAITKSGTNRFTTTVYDFYNNENFAGTTAGKDVKDRIKLGKQMSNTLGVSIGGPIIKNKLFFFANAEHVKESYPSSYNVDGGSNITKEEADKVIGKLKTLSGGYDGGGYGVQDVPTESFKFLTRIDWNISNTHKLTARYSFLKGKRLSFSNNANSLSLNDHAYNMNNNTHSLVAELNSRFSNSLSNELRVGYTRVRDNREILGQPLPYVSIRLTNNRNMQFGSERYSMANYLNQDIFTLSDNLTILSGNHTFTVGTHNEFFIMKNNFIRENYGSYVYNSIDDFLSVGTANEAMPADYNYSFLKPSVADRAWAPMFKAAQIGLYVQDEWNVNDLLKWTFGLRVDMPVFLDKPSVNADFNKTALAQKYGVATDQLPQFRPLFAPRFGFRYHLDDTRRTLFRGGLGVFTGRVPFVWISNSFSNSGVEYSRSRLNNAKLFEAAVKDGFKFQPDPAKQYVPSNLIPTEIDVVDKNFRFPQVLRGNLAVEQRLPGGIKGSMEVLVSKTLNNILYQNLAYEATGKNLTGAGGDNRPLYSKREDAKAYSDIIYMSNTSDGYTWNFTTKLEKDFNFGLSAMIAHTMGESIGINDGTSSQAYSNWQYNETYYGDILPETAYTDFDVRHRFVGSLSYKVAYAKHFATTISLLYNGQTGSRYSMVYNGDLNGDGARGNDMMYVPTDVELKNMIFQPIIDRTTGKIIATPEQQTQQLSEWINGFSDLAERKGEYIRRNGLLSPFEHHFDLHLAQDFYLNISGQKHTLQLTCDILNVGNLLNRAWGLYNSVGYSYNPITYRGIGKTGKHEYQFTKPSGDTLYNMSDYLSRWRGQIGVRYIF